MKALIKFLLIFVISPVLSWYAAGYTIIYLLNDVPGAETHILTFLLVILTTAVYWIISALIILFT